MIRVQIQRVVAAGRDDGVRVDIVTGASVEPGRPGAREVEHIGSAGNRDGHVGVEAAEPQIVRVGAEIDSHHATMGRARGGDAFGDAAGNRLVRADTDGSPSPNRAAIRHNRGAGTTQSTGEALDRDAVAGRQDSGRLAAIVEEAGRRRRAGAVDSDATAGRHKLLPEEAAGAHVDRQETRGRNASARQRRGAERGRRELRVHAAQTTIDGEAAGAGDSGGGVADVVEHAVPGRQIQNVGADVGERHRSRAGGAAAEHEAGGGGYRRGLPALRREHDTGQHVRGQHGQAVGGPALRRNVEVRHAVGGHAGARRTRERVQRIDQRDILGGAARRDRRRDVLQHHIGRDAEERRIQDRQLDRGLHVGQGQAGGAVVVDHRRHANGARHVDERGPVGVDVEGLDVRGREAGDVREEARRGQVQRIAETASAAGVEDVILAERRLSGIVLIVASRVAIERPGRNQANRTRAIIGTGRQDEDARHVLVDIVGGGRRGQVIERQRQTLDQVAAVVRERRYSDGHKAARADRRRAGLQGRQNVAQRGARERVAHQRANRHVGAGSHVEGDRVALGDRGADRPARPRADRDGRILVDGHGVGGPGAGDAIEGQGQRRGGAVGIDHAGQGGHIQRCRVARHRQRTSGLGRIGELGHAGAAQGIGELGSIRQVRGRQGKVGCAALGDRVAVRVVQRRRSFGHLNRRGSDRLRVGAQRKGQRFRRGTIDDGRCRADGHARVAVDVERHRPAHRRSHLTHGRAAQRPGVNRPRRHIGVDVERLGAALVDVAAIGDGIGRGSLGQRNGGGAHAGGVGTGRQRQRRRQVSAEPFARHAVQRHRDVGHAIDHSRDSGELAAHHFARRHAGQRVGHRPAVRHDAVRRQMEDNRAALGGRGRGGIGKSIGRLRLGQGDRRGVHAGGRLIGQRRQCHLQRAGQALARRAGQHHRDARGAMGTDRHRTRKLATHDLGRGHAGQGVTQHRPGRHIGGRDLEGDRDALGRRGGPAIGHVDDNRHLVDQFSIIERSAGARRVHLVGCQGSEHGAGGIGEDPDVVGLAGIQQIAVNAAHDLQRGGRVAAAAQQLGQARNIVQQVLQVGRARQETELVLIDRVDESSIAKGGALVHPTIEMIEARCLVACKVGTQNCPDVRIRVTQVMQFGSGEINGIAGRGQREGVTNGPAGGRRDCCQQGGTRHRIVECVVHDHRGFGRVQRLVGIDQGGLIGTERQIAVIDLSRHRDIVGAREAPRGCYAQNGLIGVANLGGCVRHRVSPL